MPLPGRPDLLRSQRRSTVARAIACFVALVVLLVSLSAEAKKKKGGKKHKTPAAKTKGKSTQAVPDSSAESDDDEDEKPSSSKPAAEEEEAKPPAPPPPSEEEEAPVKKPARAKAPPKEEAEAGEGGLFALRLGIGGGALFRNLVWTGAGNPPRVSPYSLTPGPQAAVWFEAFPAAFATDGFAANIGLFGRFNYGFGASSRLMDGTVLTTRYQDFLFGLKVRIPLGSFQPYVAGAYGNQAFQLTPYDPNASRPNFNYGFMHLGGGARIQFTPAVDLDLGAGFLLVLTPGSRNTEIAQLYPGATAYGVDVGVSLGFRLASLIGIRAGGSWRQFGVATNYQTGNPGQDADGAVDRNISLWAGLEVVFDGVGGGGSGENEDAPVKKKPAKAKKPASEDESEAPEVKPEKTEEE